jgi:hypothetical protein
MPATLVDAYRRFQHAVGLLAQLFHDRIGAQGRGGPLEVCGEDAAVNWDACHGFRHPQVELPVPSVWANRTWCKFHWELQQIFL